MLMFIYGFSDFFFISGEQSAGLEKGKVSCQDGSLPGRWTYWNKKVLASWFPLFLTCGAPCCGSPAPREPAGGRGRGAGTEAARTPVWQGEGQRSPAGWAGTGGAGADTAVTLPLAQALAFLPRKRRFSVSHRFAETFLEVRQSSQPAAPEET